MTEDERKDKIMLKLKDINDPELDMDIVNLGLIYNIEITAENKAIITMTYTVMGCPLSDILNDSIIQAVESVPGIDKCEVNLVWHPAWDFSKMSRYARISLGIRN
jgi:metal-sulfur cluster biosynthetic enzyme